jgi:hypothetical protein
MKTAKVTQAKPKDQRTPPARSNVAVLPPEARRSTAASLLKHAPGWAGDDLDEVIELVTGTRTKTRF